MSKRRTIFLAGVAVLLGGVAISGRFFIDRLDSPHDGVITLGNNSTTKVNELIPQNVSGNYVTFQYPTVLTARSKTKITPPDLEQFNYFRRDVESWDLAIDIMNQSGGVTASNSYQFRKSKPHTYIESNTTVNGQPVIIMTDTTAGGFSKVAYLSKGNYVATISLYGDDSSGIQPLSETFNMVLQSWKWR